MKLQDINNLLEASVKRSKTGTNPKQGGSPNNQKQDAVGTYMAYDVSFSTAKQIRNFTTDFDIPNPVDPEDMHCTVIYSRNNLPDLQEKGHLSASILAYDPQLELWPTQDGAKALVARLECDMLKDRHAEIMNDYNATFDYDEYIPHVTLSYDVEDWTMDNPQYLSSELDKYVQGVVEFVREYKEDLDLNKDYTKSEKDSSRKTTKKK